MKTSIQKKELGAYYTDPRVAEFLVRWAVRTPNDRILDPSFGEGVFLEAALNVMGESKEVGEQIYGVEIDDSEYDRAIEKFSEWIPEENLIHSDFFEVIGGENHGTLAETQVPAVDAVVGNPPYIRYHRWKGKTRKRAQEKAETLGVEINGLSSSWAPFVVYSTSFLKKGGRLAMVLPAEIMHAFYAKPVLEYLHQTFKLVRLIAFREKLFSQLSEDTLLILCDEKGCGPSEMFLTELQNVSKIDEEIPTGTSVESKSVLAGESKLIEYLLPDKIRQLYSRIKQDARSVKLGDIADVGIGYVTGNNDFFHLSRSEVEALGIPEEALSRCLRNSRHIQGLVVTDDDWEKLRNKGEAVFLLNLAGLEPLADAIEEYLRTGEERGVHQGYKCRNRKPWYVVPHVYKSDGLLTYMSGKRSRLVVNKAGIYVPNTLHTVRLREPHNDIMLQLSLSWLSSFTRLSVEIEGRSLGGGMLKLEPSEAQRVLVTLPELAPKPLNNTTNKIDHLLRDNKWTEAMLVADHAVLRQTLGLDDEEIQLLRQGAKELREKRYSR